MSKINNFSDYTNQYNTNADYSYLFGGTLTTLGGGSFSLSDYATHIYYYFKDFADSERLRETLICDLLSSSSALQIPEIFKRKNDPLYKKVKKHFTKDTTALNKAAILYKTGKVFVVNQRSQKDFNGRYESNFYDLENFIN